MVNVCYEISKEEYEKALLEGPYSIMSEAVINGYGAYCAKVWKSETEDKYYLSYSRGDSCD